MAGTLFIGAGSLNTSLVKADVTLTVSNIVIGGSDIQYNIGLYD